MLEDAAGIRRVVIACGYVDLRKGIDGLSMIIGDRYHQNPFEKGTLFLFCGRRSDRIKGLLWMGDGFLQLYKRLEAGSLSWPRTSEEAAKAHLIFVQNIDFLCLLSSQIHSRCYSLFGRCFMVCDVSTGESG